MSKTKMKKKVLKMVLEPSWADLGSFGVPFWGIFLILAKLLQCFLNIQVFEKIRLQEATWADLGSSRVPAWGHFW